MSAAIGIMGLLGLLAFPSGYDNELVRVENAAFTSFSLSSVIAGSDPTSGWIPPTSDGWNAWKVAGMNAMPLTAGVSGTTLTVATSFSKALGPSEVVTCAGCTSGMTITAFGTGTGAAGTYTVSCSGGCATVAGGTAMTAAGIPNRTTISATLSPSGGDDTSAITSALASCSAGQVVLLNTGVFKVSGNGIIFNANGCTLRGSGPGSQTNTGLNAVNAGTGGPVQSCVAQTQTTNSVYCVDATATQIIKTDRATVQTSDIFMYFPGTNVWATSYNLASDAVPGTYSITLASAPSGISPGDMIFLDALTTSDPSLVWGPSFNGVFNSIGYGMRRVNSSVADVMEVQSVSGSTVTFTTPITWAYSVADSSQMTTYPAQFLHGAGVENLFVWGGEHSNIEVTTCAYCWVKNVEAGWSINPNIAIEGGFKNVVRDSFIHETPNATPGGAGYQFDISGGASETLVENNAIWYGNKVDVMRAAGGGNVFAYNYTDDAFGATYPDQVEAGVNAAHLTTTHMTLMEGNYGQNFKGDTYWGSTLYTTALRNWFSAHRAAHAPLNTFTYNNGSCLATYGDYYGASRAAVDVQAYSYNTNFVGNVLGMSGQSLLTEPGPSPCFPAQPAFVVQITTVAQALASSGTFGGANDVPMWQIGAYQASVNSPSGSYVPLDCAGQSGQTVPGWIFDGCTVQTMTRKANWDWVSAAETTYVFGSATTTSNPVSAIPSSFYLTTGKPSFFGTHPWPWPDATTGNTSGGSGSTQYMLPAMYCFQQNEMPGCALP